MREVVEDLIEIVDHRGFEALKRRCVGPWELGPSWRDNLEKLMRIAMDSNDMPKARYYQGQIECLDRLFGDAIPEWVRELRETK